MIQSKNILNYFCENDMYTYTGLLISFFAVAFIINKIIQLYNIKNERYKNFERSYIRFHAVLFSTEMLMFVILPCVVAVKDRSYIRWDASFVVALKFVRSYRRTYQSIYSGWSPDR